MTKDFEFLSAAERGAAPSEKREKSERRERIINAATRWIMIASGAAAAGVVLAFLTAFLSASAHADILRTGVWAGSATTGSDWVGSSLQLQTGMLGVDIVEQSGDLPRTSGVATPGPAGLLGTGGADTKHAATSVAGLSWQAPILVLPWGAAYAGVPAAAELTIKPAITTAGDRSLGGLGWDARLDIAPGISFFTQRSAWRVHGASAPISAGLAVARQVPYGILSFAAARLEGTGSAASRRHGYSAATTWASADGAWRVAIAAQDMHGGDALPLAVQPASPSAIVGSTYASHAVAASVEHQFNSRFSAGLSVTSLPHSDTAGGVSIAYHF